MDRRAEDVQSSVRLLYHIKNKLIEKIIVRPPFSESKRNWEFVRSLTWDVPNLGNKIFFINSKIHKIQVHKIGVWLIFFKLNLIKIIFLFALCWFSYVVVAIFSIWKLSLNIRVVRFPMIEYCTYGSYGMDSPTVLHM